MLKNRRAVLVLFLLLLGAFMLGVTQLFTLRFEAGDVYPPYSSLRTDPLGAQAFYESLDHLPGLTVQRLYEPLPKLHGGRDTTLLLLGAGPNDITRLEVHEADELEKFMIDGGRIVVSLYPQAGKTWTTRRREKEDQKKQKEKSAEPKKGEKDAPKEKKPGPADPDKPARRKSPTSDDDDVPTRTISLRDKWGVNLEYNDSSKDAEGRITPLTAYRETDSDRLPPAISWHTALYFDKLDREWRAVYAQDGHPVLIERQIGKGSFVLAADSYFLSNEAMRGERHTTLLAWLVGANSRLAFDETHLGVQADPGIAALIRKYRLHGLVAGLVLLSGLFVWKNSTSLVPPLEENAMAGRENLVTGKDSAAGFVNLLRRSVPPADLLNVCLAEWKKSCGRAGLSGKMEQMETVFKADSNQPPKARDPVQTYQTISRILTTRK